MSSTLKVLLAVACRGRHESWVCCIKYFNNSLGSSLRLAALRRLTQPSRWHGYNHNVCTTIIFFWSFYSGGWIVWSLKFGKSVWEFLGHTQPNLQYPTSSTDQSSSIVYSDRAGHLAFYCSTLFGIVLGRHARMLATLCCVSVQQPVETAMLGLICMRK